MVLKWRNSSSWVVFKNMGCSTLTAAVPFATAILARCQKVVGQAQRFSPGADYTSAACKPRAKISSQPSFCNLIAR